MSEVQKLDSKTMISVLNKRNTKYSASLPNGDYYEWLPCANGIEDEIEMPFKDVQSLHMRSRTFKEGFLYINHDEARKRLGLESEEVKKLNISREEIEKMLKGNIQGMKKLESFKGNTNIVREIVDVAKDLKIDNVTKLDFLSELSGIPVDILKESITQ